jgi:hypothetical protein
VNGTSKDAARETVSARRYLWTVAFTDYCPEPCHVGTGIAAVVTVWAIVAVITVLGTTLSIVRLLRRRAWIFALATLVLVIVGSIAAFWLYAGIVGY